MSLPCHVVPLDTFFLVECRYVSSASCQLEKMWGLSESGDEMTLTFFCCTHFNEAFFLVFLIFGVFCTADVLKGLVVDFQGSWIRAGSKI